MTDGKAHPLTIADTDLDRTTGGFAEILYVGDVIKEDDTSRGHSDRDGSRTRQGTASIYGNLGPLGSGGS